MDAQVSWKKDSITLERGVQRSFRKLDPEARVIVDAFGTLYLIGTSSRDKLHIVLYGISHFSIYIQSDVSTHEEGNYTCYIDNVNMMQVKVIVISKARLVTQGKIKTKLFSQL